MNQKSKPEEQTFGEILQERFERRSLLGGVMKAVPLAALFGRWRATWAWWRGRSEGRR